MVRTDEERTGIADFAGARPVAGLHRVPHVTHLAWRDVRHDRDHAPRSTRVEWERRAIVTGQHGDAIALALRTNSPIWVMEEVVADASMPVDRDADEAERQAFNDFLENLRPEDLIQRSPFNKSSQEE